MVGHYLDRVLREWMNKSLKGDTTDIVHNLGPQAMVQAIIDKMDSIYSSISTFNVLMQGFHHEQQGRVEAITHFVARLEGQLNSIHMKHPTQITK